MYQRGGGEAGTRAEDPRRRAPTLDHPASLYSTRELVENWLDIRGWRVACVVVGRSEAGVIVLMALTLYCG